MPPVPALLDPSMPTPRRRDVEPARFHAVLNMILAAIKNVNARVHFLRVALDDDDVARSKPHVVVSAAKLGASLNCLLASTPGTVEVPPLLLRAPVQEVPAVTDPAQLDLVKQQLLKARSAADNVTNLLNALSEKLSNDTLLLAQAVALDMVIKAGQLLRDMGKLLDNFQQFAIPLTPRTEIHPQLRRLREALLSAIDGIKKRQVAMLQKELSNARSLDQAVAIANVVRKVEKSISRDGEPNLLMETVTKPPPPPIGFEPEPSQKLKLETLCEVVGYGFNEISARLTAIRSTIASSDTKQQIVPTAQLLRQVGIFLDSFLKQNPEPMLPSTGSPAVSGLSQSIHSGSTLADRAASTTQPALPSSSSTGQSGSLGGATTAGSLSESAPPRLPSSHVLALKKQAQLGLRELQGSVNNFIMELEANDNEEELLLLAKIAQMIKKLMDGAPMDPSWRNVIQEKPAPGAASGQAARLRFRSLDILTEAKGFLFSHRQGLLQLDMEAEVQAVVKVLDSMNTVCRFFAQYRSEAPLRSVTTLPPPIATSPPAAAAASSASTSR